MELITSNRRNFLPVQARRPWVPAILDRYGDFEQLLNRFGPRPDVQRYCYENIAWAVHPASGVECLARMIHAYGRAKIKALIVSHLTATLIYIGREKDMDPQQVKFTASAIVDHNPLASLKFSTVIGFFHYLNIGLYEWKSAPSQQAIMAAYRQYGEYAMNKEYSARERMERERRETERRIHDSQCRPWEESCRRLGLPEGTSLADWVSGKVRPRLQSEDSND